MKIPLSWIKEFIDVSLDADSLAKMLTMAGLEVDGIENITSDQGNDIVFDISITPNLTHCSSVYGIARDLSALTGSSLRHPQPTLKEDKGETVQSAIVVEIKDKKNCPRYCCRIIKGVKVEPSPQWLLKRLEICGIRPVNNVVDVTNYCLWELGHPLHAFDYDEISGHRIEVRMAKENETIITLDENSRILNKETVVICDDKHPLAIAGIMGGANSEVTSETTNILLESAYFEPKNIRRSSKALGLTTEASRRFERGADPNSTIFALERASELIQKIAGGKVLDGVLDVKEVDFIDKIIQCRFSRINSLLGLQLGLSEVERILKQLHFSYRWDGNDIFTIKVPTYRVDVSLEVDIIEEISRVYGYNNIPRKSPRSEISSLSHAPSFIFEREMRDRLIAEGLQEFLTCDLISPTQVDWLPDQMRSRQSIIKVMNPTSIEQSVMRPSLLPGLLQVVKYNYDHQNQDVSGFEIGRIHFKEADRFEEQLMAGIILSGKRAPYHFESKETPLDFYDLKGIIENLLDELGVKAYTFKKSHLSSFHNGRQASIYIDSLEIGVLGEIHPFLLRHLDVPQRIFFSELNLQDLFNARKSDSKMVPLPRFPASERDWTLTIDEGIPMHQLFEAVQIVPSTLLENVKLQDVYHSEKLGKDRKNVTLRFVYRDRDKTIAQQEVEKEHTRIVQGALGHLGDKLKG